MLITFILTFAGATMWWRWQNKKIEKYAQQLEDRVQLESPKTGLEKQAQQLEEEIQRLEKHKQERLQNLRIPAIYNLGNLLVNNLLLDDMIPLIQKLFIETQSQIEGIALDQQEGGYGGSLVLRSHLRRGGRLYLQPSYIIKIGDDALRHEAQNAQTARGDIKRVPSIYKRPLSETGREDKKYTGIVYEFADIKGKIKSFSEFYQASNSESDDLKKNLEKIFTRLKVWYDEYQRVDGVSLYDEYRMLYEKQEAIRQGIEGITNQQNSEHLGFFNQFPLPDESLWYDPMRFVEEWDLHRDKATLPFYRSVVHGDAHSRNFLIDNKQRIWYIDFSHWPNGLSKKRTEGFINDGIKIDPKRGHTLRDMAKLEADLKFILTPLRNEADWNNAVKFEIDLLDELKWGNDELPKSNPAWVDIDEFRKAWVAIQTIRRVARPYLCDERDKRPYYWSLLRFTLAILYYTTPEFGNEKEGRELRELWQKRYAFTAAGLLCGRLL